MTTTFIIVYILIALILLGLINFFVSKGKKKTKNQKVEQRSTKGSESQSYQSKFKASDLEKSESQTSSPNDFSSTSNHIEDDKRKHHFESMNESDDSTKNEHGTLRRSEDTSHKSDEDSGVDEVHKPINPNSEEARVNEKIKNQQSDFIFGKGITRGKILAAMLFGMFIAILNQTLLNVALPKINTEFNISASTGQWLMTGFINLCDFNELPSDDVWTYFTSYRCWYLNAIRF